MQRRTRIVLSIPWDDEDNSHPSGWGYDVLLNVPDERQVIVVDFEDTNEDGTLKAV